MIIFKEDFLRLRRPSSLLLLYVFWIFTDKLGHANSCDVDVPPLFIDEDENWRNKPLSIEAMRIEAFGSGEVLYKGDVAAQQGLRSFTADEASLDKKTGEMRASGNISFSDGRITIHRGQSLRALQDKAFIQLGPSRYQLHGYPGRGEAQITTYDTKNLNLKQASFTTCPIDNPFWLLRAKEINVKKGDVFGEAWHASLWIKNKPLFYFPYFNFPVQNKRQSGFLYPKYTHSTLNGYEISLPFYWNLAPNYDVTFQPRWIEKRGLMQSVEYRYLPSQDHHGRFYTEYLHQDHIFSDKKRWLFHWEHQGKLGDTPLRAKTSISRVAPKDYNYFNELKPNVGTLNKNSLEQSLQLTWPEKTWDVIADVRTYQTLLPEALTPHMMLPRITYRQFWQNRYLATRLYSEITHFEHRSERKPAYSGTRLHIEPEIYIPLLLTPEVSVDVQLNLPYTLYTQQMPDNLDTAYIELGLNELKKETDRFVPQLEINNHWFFQRTWSLMSANYQQTLEPRLTYFYTPYRKQDHIGIFDTTSLPQDYYSLFYGRRFAGLDRISDANKLTLGLTSSLIDPETGTELFRIGAAQAFHVHTPRVTLFPSQNPSANKRSFFSLEADTYLSPQWLTHIGWQYDTDNMKFQAFNAAAELKKQATELQFNYRFVDHDAFSALDLSAPNTNINQVGILLTQDLTPHVQAVAAYYLNLNDNNPIERKLGFRYDACCWSASFIMQWQNIPDNISQKPRVNTSYGFQLELKGLGDLGIKAKEFNLDTTLLPHTRPFNLIPFNQKY